MQEVGQVVRFEGDIEDELRRIGMFRVGDGHRSDYMRIVGGESRRRGSSTEKLTIHWRFVDNNKCYVV